MTQNQYDYIIIGAGHNDLTPSLSPTGDGNKKPHFSRGLVVTNYGTVSTRISFRIAETSSSD